MDFQGKWIYHKSIHRKTLFSFLIYFNKIQRAVSNFKYLCIYLTTLIQKNPQILVSFQIYFNKIQREISNSKHFLLMHLSYHCNPKKFLIHTLKHRPNTIEVLLMKLLSSSLVPCNNNSMHEIHCLNYFVLSNKYGVFYRTEKKNNK